MLKYTREQRLEIGRRIYEGEINRFEAAREYDICDQTARDYMRLYRGVKGLPPRSNSSRVRDIENKNSDRQKESYENMSREALISQLIEAKAKIEELQKSFKESIT